MNTWFGNLERPWGKLCVSMPYVATPVGQACLHCEEEIKEGDEGEMMPGGGAIRPVHAECLLRMVMGSVGHQQRRCPCYNGTEEDPPGMTTRQAAIAAAEYFHRPRQKNQSPPTDEDKS